MKEFSSIENNRLLVKGGSLCHGVGGNAYALLRIYNCTKKSEYLYQAVTFVRAFFTKKYQQLRTDEEDRPYSLYGGLGGIASILLDILNDPKLAMLPAFEDI